MNRLARRLLCLYPAGWRARYGQEFTELIEEASLTWWDLFDIALGALRAHRMDGGVFRMHDKLRIIELASRDLPHGIEFESAVELPQPDGGTIVARNFTRDLDFGDSYLTINHWARGDQPAQTAIVFGRKGSIDGDFRTDETEMLLLRADGTIRRTEQTVKTWLKGEAIRQTLRDRYRSGMAAGLTPDEVHRQIYAEYQGSANA